MLQGQFGRLAPIQDRRGDVGRQEGQSDALADALPSKDQIYLSCHGYEFEAVMEGGNTGIILKNLPLPDGKFNHTAADVLILLPRGYSNSRMRSSPMSCAS